MTTHPALMFQLVPDSLHHGVGGRLWRVVARRQLRSVVDAEHKVAVSVISTSQRDSDSQVLGSVDIVAVRTLEHGGKVAGIAPSIIGMEAVDDFGTIEVPARKGEGAQDAVMPAPNATDLVEVENLKRAIKDHIAHIGARPATPRHGELESA